MNPSGNQVQVVVNTTGASGLDYHYQKNTLYWSDVKTKRVSQLTPTTKLGIINFHYRYIHNN